MCLCGVVYLVGFVVEVVLGCGVFDEVFVVGD